MTMTLSEEHIRTLLRTVRDPEIGLDIVTLGLLQTITITQSTVAVRMMLTTPGCPLTGYFVREVQRALLAHDAIEDVTVDFVLDPPWTPARIEKSARLTIGI